MPGHPGLDAPRFLPTVPPRMTPSAHPTPPGWLRRWVAMGCASLVLGLTVLAACPAAHAWLHTGSSSCGEHTHEPGGESPADDTGCAVVLFATGIANPVHPTALIPPTLVAQAVATAASGDLCLRPPRYLRQPERGPPARD